MAIRILVDRPFTPDGKHYIEASCDAAADGDPTTAMVPGCTGFVSGSRSVVVATGDVKLYNEGGGSWQTEFSLQG